MIVSFTHGNFFLFYFLLPLGTSKYWHIYSWLYNYNIVPIGKRVHVQILRKRLGYCSRRKYTIYFLLRIHLFNEAINIRGNFLIFFCCCVDFWSIQHDCIRSINILLILGAQGWLDAINVQLNVEQDSISLTNLNVHKNKWKVGIDFPSFSLSILYVYKNEEKTKHKQQQQLSLTN